MAVEDREYDAGFWIPDMQDDDNLAILKAWNGEWTALNTFKYIRLSRDGILQQSNFPPKGLS
jgi:translation machinery-associated protein 16